ncbi:MAG: chorismate synthase, partial [Proteobacteria bacterium]|nr:chorismate synthase [Pseudomonadota bacterium]
MPGNTWGQLFRITTFGESHGGAVGVVIDGCPPGLLLDLSLIQLELDRRRPGQSEMTSSRQEADRLRVLSGLFEGRTLGTPLVLMVENTEGNPSEYAAFKDKYRPSHADYTYEAKYGLRAWAGGGRASARETVGRVAAGAVARQVLSSLGSVEVLAWVERVGHIQASIAHNEVTRHDVEASRVRCPDAKAALAMEAAIDEVKARGDTLGGVVRCVAHQVPAGLGEPVFDKLEAELAKALLSIPAAKGFESGSGFAGTRLLGSEHNDRFVGGPKGIATKTNFSGGIQGGISNGMP